MPVSRADMEHEFSKHLPSYAVPCAVRYFMNETTTGITTSKTIKVATSELGGQGVFATRNIPKGTLVTRYPTHMVELRQHHYYTLAHSTCDLHDLLERSKALRLQVPLAAGVTMVIRGDPQLYSEEACGHKVNDCSRPNLSRSQHAELEKIHCNCVWHHAVGASYIKTTRRVKKGEELLVSYGWKYWCDQTARLAT